MKEKINTLENDLKEKENSLSILITENEKFKLETNKLQKDIHELKNENEDLLSERNIIIKKSQNVFKFFITNLIKAFLN